VALAVTEAIANVVCHAYPPERAGEALVTVAVDGDQVVVCVQDFGVGRSGFRASAARGMGLGLRLIRSVCAELRIEADAAGTTLVMRFVPAG
jgi:anti-sigma regulatory factor (Ser/Thr protein kinase)